MQQTIAKFHTGDAPFGTFQPNGRMAIVKAIARRTSPGPLGQQLVMAIRRTALWGMQTPVDTTVFDMRLRLFPQDNLSERRVLFAPQHWEARERMWLSSQLRPGACFVDIGANAGLYSLFVWSETKRSAKILAIEPQPVMAGRLRFNFALNGIDVSNIHQVAISDRLGEARFGIAPSRGESGLGVSGDSIVVKTQTLLNLLDEVGIERPDIVKIDIEGAEDLAMAPFLTQAATNRLPRCILIEDSSVRWRQDLFALAAQRGYSQALRTKRNVGLLREIS
jgi:FkbM family methyltransferase